VVRDKRTEKSKGYGFVSFSDGEDYFRAAREMQGKYIGSHPVLLRRATTEIRPVISSKGAKGSKKGGANGSGGGGAGRGASGKGSGGGKSIDAGVHKKQGKMKGGLRVLG
jgi:RNA recognition motif-containing protein